MRWMDLEPALTECSKSERKTSIMYYCIYVESRKMVLMDLLSGQQWRCRYREQTCGHGVRVREGENGTDGESSMETCTPPYVK